jgi:SAM-dependent methyltransferase
VPWLPPAGRVENGHDVSGLRRSAQTSGVTEPSEQAPSTAATEGPEWGAKAIVWAELWAGLAHPAREVVARATGIGPGMRVLDVGCGSGEFCALAGARGAVVSGIDAAEGMIEIARRLAPEADLRVGAMERLPWADDGFDLVTGFNAFQFASDFVPALAEARRVTRVGGRVAICNWGRLDDRELFAVLRPLRELRQPSPPVPPALGEPGVLEGLARRAGLEPRQAGEVDVPYEVPDQATLERAFLVDAGVEVIEHAGEHAVRRTIVTAAAPFRRPDGSYRFENRFRYLVADV